MNEKSRALTLALEKARRHYPIEFERTGLELALYRDFAFFRDLQLLFKADAGCEARISDRPAGVLESLQCELSPAYQRISDLGRGLRIEIRPEVITPFRSSRGFDPYVLRVPYNDLAGEFRWLMAQEPSVDALATLRTLVNLNLFFFHNILHSIYYVLVPSTKEADPIDYLLFIESLVVTTEEAAVLSMGYEVYELLRKLGLFLGFFAGEDDFRKYDFPSRIVEQLEHRHRNPSSNYAGWVSSYARSRYPAEEMENRRARAEEVLPPFRLKGFSLKEVQGTSYEELLRLEKWIRELGVGA